MAKKLRTGLGPKPWPLQVFLKICSIGDLRRCNWPCIYVRLVIDKNRVLTARRCGRCRSCKDRKKIRGKL